MPDFGAPPVIPDTFHIYNSYAEDPKWQRRFTLIWCSVLALFILLALPHLFRALRRGTALTGFFGVRERLGTYGYEAVVRTVAARTPARRSKRMQGVLKAAGAVLLWTPPWVELNVGQLIVVVGYVAVVVVCMVVNVPLKQNPNRAGFLALAQLPVVFLFATKNSLLSLLLGPGHGYEKLNFVHKWAGRSIFLCGLVHGALWIRDHRQFGLPILGPQKETSGVATLATLGIIAIMSLRPVRRACYQVFFVVHTLMYVAFFVTMCYHTVYAAPWIFPPLAFFGADVLMRFLRFRIKDATLVPVDKQMTIIHVHDCDAGWTAGQHVRLRVFFDGRVFESHPLTILNAPPATTCLALTTASRALLLGARTQGDWTYALNAYARAERARLDETLPARADEKAAAKEEAAGVPVQVTIDGPYGGCSVDLGRFEHVFLLAGGSGATFALGLLDDLVGRCVRLGRPAGERTRRIEFAWCVRSFGAIAWFAPMLQDIAHTAARAGPGALDLHMSVFVTCLCDPEAVPPLPNSSVAVERPSVLAMLRRFAGVDADADADVDADADIAVDADERARRLRPVSQGSASSDGSHAQTDEKARARAAVQAVRPGSRAGADALGVAAGLRVGGGVAVCASGPESLAREAANAVARLGMVHGAALGGVALHTEVFAL